MSRGVVRMADQFHFDPGTYLEMVRAEVPDYEQLQEVVAEAASEIRADTILDLGTGTGETLRRVARRHPTARLIGIDESDRMLVRWDLEALNAAVASCSPTWSSPTTRTTR